MNWICDGCEYIKESPYICIWACPIKIEKGMEDKNDRKIYPSKPIYRDRRH